MKIEEVLSTTKCPICDGVVTSYNYAYMFRCQNGCYTIDQFVSRDDVYIFGNFYCFPAPNREISNESLIKYQADYKAYSEMIDFWRENDRYLMRIMIGENNGV